MPGLYIHMQTTAQSRNNLTITVDFMQKLFEKMHYLSNMRNHKCVFIALAQTEIKQ